MSPETQRLLESLRASHGSVELSFGVTGWLAMVCDKGGEPWVVSEPHVEVDDAIADLSAKIRGI